MISGTIYGRKTVYFMLKDIENVTLLVLPDKDSSFSIMNILEDRVVREDDKGIEPETEEEKTRVPST